MSLDFIEYRFSYEDQIQFKPSVFEQSKGDGLYIESM
jgi:hypothetical protein